MHTLDIIFSIWIEPQTLIISEPSLHLIHRFIDIQNIKPTGQNIRRPLNSARLGSFPNDDVSFHGMPRNSIMFDAYLTLASSSGQPVKSIRMSHQNRMEINTLILKRVAT